MPISDYTEVMDREKASDLSIGDKLAVNAGKEDLARYKIIQLESKEAGIKVHADLIGDEE